MIYNYFKEQVKKYPQKKALVYNSCSVTYSEIDNKSNSIAELLNDYVEEQDRVIVLLKNSIVFVETFLAINRINAIIVPISHKTTIKQLLHYINIVEPKAVICNIDTANELCQTIYSGSVFVVDYINNELFLFRNPKDRICLDKEKNDISTKTSIAEILFTSGTTGEPKGIMLSNENIINNIIGIFKYLNPHVDDIFLIIKPLHHASTLNGELLLGLLSCCTIVMTNLLLSPRTIGNLIVQNCVCVTFATPLLLQYFLEMPDEIRTKVNEFLKVLHFYGAPLPECILKRLIEKLPDVELIYSYGLTEASPRVTFIKKNNLLKKPLSSGKPLENVEIEIVDTVSNKKQPIGRIGEIVVRGPNIMVGYYKNETLSNKVISSGWLKTGDLGYIDRDGDLYHKGRVDDLIVKGGINIYPAEIENVIYEIPAVQDVFVFGREHPIYGNEIVAYIVIKKGCNLKSSEVTQYLLNYLEPVKCPNDIVFVDSLKLSESGKISRIDKK